jgi:hypothetical protein
MTVMSRERPTFARWRQIHAHVAARTPWEFAAKHDTRKSFHWVVLTFLEYDRALIDQVQPTWFRGKGGSPTAWGVIRAAWERKARDCFLVEAWNRRRRDTYVVVFEKDGRFLTAYSKTRDDAPIPLFPLSAKAAGMLLRLNDLVPDSELRVISDELILASLVSRGAARITRGFKRASKHYLPLAVRQGLVIRVDDQLCFVGPRANVRQRLFLLSPPSTDRNGSSRAGEF